MSDEVSLKAIMHPDIGISGYYVDVPLKYRPVLEDILRAYSPEPTRLTWNEFSFDPKHRADAEALRDIVQQIIDKNREGKSVRGHLANANRILAKSRSGR